MYEDLRLVKGTIFSTGWRGFRILQLEKYTKNREKKNSVYYDVNSYY